MLRGKLPGAVRIALGSNLNELAAFHTQMAIKTLTDNSKCGEPYMQLFEARSVNHDISPICTSKSTQDNIHIGS
uniref:Uncharacterized protein n=1 Tax=Setaria italica TaxID=4555 RepID=K4AHL1_SETIT